MVKKKDCFMCNLTLLFLCIIFFAFMVYSFIPFVFSEQEFKITKEECWIENNGLRYTDCQLGCYYIYDNTNISLKEYSNCNLWCMNVFEKEVCEKIEVNEINHTIDALEDRPSVIELWEYYCIDNYDFNKEECDTLPRYFDVQILKEELTMSFLDRYCIVTSLNCDESYVIEQIDYNKEDRFCCFHDKIIGTGICGDSLINKYKCEFKEEYFIEVLKWTN